MILILLAKTCCLCSWFTNWDDTWLHETQLRTSHRQFSQETVQLTATLTPSRPNEKRTTCPFGKRFTWRIRQETDSLPQSHPETTTWLSHMRYPVRTNKRKLKCTIYVYIYMDAQYDAKYVISYIQLMHNDMQISLYICACVHVLC